MHASEEGLAADADQLDIEDERGTGRDVRLHASAPICRAEVREGAVVLERRNAVFESPRERTGKVGGARQRRLLSLAHLQHAHVPALDNVTGTNLELERAAQEATRGVKHRSVGQLASVVRRNHLASLRIRLPICQARQAAQRRVSSRLRASRVCIGVDADARG